MLDLLIPKMSIENEIILETEVVYTNKEKQSHEGKLYFYISGLKFIPYDNNTATVPIVKSDIESIIAFYCNRSSEQR